MMKIVMKIQILLLVNYLLITDNIEMFKTPQGHIRMRDSFGFVYQQCGKNADGSLYWRCEMERKRGFLSCKAKAKSLNGFLVSLRGQHNHLV